MDAPRLSVVVPAFNEERYLPRTLAALAESLGALGAPSEVIVADDASTDRTAAVAAAAGARVVSCAHRQIARARNSGGAAALGDRLLFVDADTEVPPATLLAAWRALEAGAVGGGCRMEMDSVPTAFARAALAAWNAVSRLGRWAAGGFFFCRADAFRAVGGFPDDLYVAEEIGLARRLKRWGRAHGRPFVVLGEAVRTSARKATLYTTGEILRTLAGQVRGGLAGLRDRSLAGPWYDGRR